MQYFEPQVKLLSLETFVMVAKSFDQTEVFMRWWLVRILLVAMMVFLAEQGQAGKRRCWSGKALRGLKVHLVRIDELSSGLRTLRFEPCPSQLQAGGSIQLSPGLWRGLALRQRGVYSPSKVDADGFEITLRTTGRDQRPEWQQELRLPPPMSVILGERALADGGMRVRVITAGGYELETYKTSLVFISGGTGVAKNMSILRDIVSANRWQGHIVFIYSARFHSEFLFLEELQQLQQQGRIDLHLFATREARQRRLERKNLQVILKSPIEIYQFFVCGPQAFEATVFAYLQDMEEKA